MSTRIVEGKIVVHPRGFGFVEFAEGSGKAVAFVAPPQLNAFLQGDRVRAEIAESAPGKLEARSIELLSRRRTRLFGRVAHHGKRLFLRVDREVSNTDWPLEGQDLAEGTPVVATIEGDRAKLERTLAQGADVALERVIARHSLSAEHPSESRLEAEKVAKRGPSGARQDLREIPTVTIDAIHSRDLDDALAVVPAGDDGALRVLVSIADVDAFVPEGSALDREARRRGTSVYLAGRVLPMFPELLSNDAISLNEGVDRPAMTVELRVDAEGEVRSVDVYASLIRSHARLTYDAVAQVFAGHDDAVPKHVLATVRWLRTAAARLSISRGARGGVEVLGEEASMSFDEAREPTEVIARIDNDAHRLVERLMVAANEAVARWLVERGLPGVFRVHEEPEPSRVETLAASARRFGFEPGFGRTMSPRALAAFEAQLHSSPSETALRTVLRRALGPAKYTVDPSPHFGLAAPLYLHFTSPIRRYADLAVHRIVKRYLAGDRSMTAGDRAIEELSVALNDSAREATKAEQESVRMLSARLFATRIGEHVHGSVIAVKPFGLVVMIAGAGVTGSVATEAFGEAAHVDLAREEIRVGARSYALGDSLALVVSGANEELGRIELSPRAG